MGYEDERRFHEAQHYGAISAMDIGQMGLVLLHQWFWVVTV